MSKPITLFGHGQGPNPWKVAIILEELGVPYKIEMKEFPDMKKPEYEKINPNGRVPAIIDPNNNDFTIWESGAIVEYLLDKYGASSPINVTTDPDKYLAKQYLHYQMSGQGPYFGQAMWFVHFHHEKLESPQDRYLKEVKRIVSVVNEALKRNPSGWLVGKDCTYADLVFVPWFWLLPALEGREAGLVASLEKENPEFAKWWAAINDRPAVKKIKADREAVMKK